MNMDAASKGVIGKRVQMDSVFLMALDYMIQLAKKDQHNDIVIEMFFIIITYGAMIRSLGLLGGERFDSNLRGRAI